jgi:hypothetical protein
MPASLPKSAPRTHVESLRSDSHVSVPALDDLRAVSHMVRIDAKPEFLSAINEARTRLGLTVEKMAATVGCSLSQMSDALAGKVGRNFAGHWLLALGDDFTDVFNRIIEERRGHTPQAKRARKARNLAELVRRAVEDLE